MTLLSEINMIQALNNALDLHMKDDSLSVILGEDIGYFGGVFRVTQGLQKKYGANRVIDTPLNECGIVGTAIGMALGGLKPIVEIQFADFVFPAFDQIVNELAKYRYRSGGQYGLPIVIRMPYGGGIKGGHYHSQSPEALFAHTPGLRVLIPSGPVEAKGLLLSALTCEDPVIFLEPKRVYRTIKEDVPSKYYTLPLDKAQLVSVGSDVTLISYGAMTDICKETVSKAKEAGIGVDHINLLSLVPLDTDTLCKSASKTGRVIVVHEAPKTCGYGAELVASIQERVFTKLQAPIVRVTGFDTPFPYALESDYLPNSDRILSAVSDILAY